MSQKIKAIETAVASGSVRAAQSQFAGVGLPLAGPLSITLKLKEAMTLAEFEENYGSQSWQHIDKITAVTPYVFTIEFTQAPDKNDLYLDQNRVQHKVEKVVLGSGITQIPEAMFSGALVPGTTVFIPKTVETINESAFSANQWCTFIFEKRNNNLAIYDYSFRPEYAAGEDGERNYIYLPPLEGDAHITFYYSWTPAVFDGCFIYAPNSYTNESIVAETQGDQPPFHPMNYNKLYYGGSASSAPWGALEWEGHVHASCLISSSGATGTSSLVFQPASLMTGNRVEGWFDKNNQPVGTVDITLDPAQELLDAIYVRDEQGYPLGEGRFTITDWKGLTLVYAEFKAKTN